ncbi:hypothetical protein [Parabacteroides distasonis]|uniref:hypothetical protein n=1 Tax=Parabacteroides distasonis TaxID=823 RepID=UPI0032C10695
MLRERVHAVHVMLPEIHTSHTGVILRGVFLVFQLQGLVIRHGYILLVRKVGYALVTDQLLGSLGKIVRIDGTGLQVRYLLVGDVDYLVPQSSPGDIRITDNVTLMVSPSTVYRDLRGKVDVRLETGGMG